MANNVSGTNNVAVGWVALTQNNASYNTGLGAGALQFNSTGQHNTAVGYLAGINSETGSYNTAVGDSALGLVLLSLIL